MTGKHRAKFRKLPLKKPHLHIPKSAHAVVGGGYLTAAVFFHGHSAELMAAAYGTAALLEAHESKHHGTHEASA